MKWPEVETDPEDEWMYVRDLTDDELADVRALQIESNHDTDGYTCDTCQLARRCTLAWDQYNTDGDCLLEK